jgi:hypothetical protein
VWAAAGLAAVLVACGSDRARFDDPGSPAPGGGGNGGGGGSPDLAANDGGAPGPRPTVARLRGKVVAPEGTVPVSNALVYLTTRLPDAIPEHVYCDTCVKLTPNEPYAYSDADGTFDLGAYATGKQYLVVQKGQFRRAREIDVAAGDQSVPGPLTRLPGKNDAANNDTIPRIAMANGAYDKIDYSMKKLGIEEFYRYGDGPIDFGGPPPGTKTGKSTRDLTQSIPELLKHHIVLLPCATFGFDRNDTQNRNVCGAPTGAEQAAFKSYVDAGGKLYVTDYSYEAVRQTWPGYVTFYDDRMQPLSGTSSGVGTACRGGAEDTPGEAQDPGLKSWMGAIGHANVTLQQSWSRIASVSPQPGFDPENKPKTITPKVWMTSNVGGQKLPATVSFEQRCGRVLFSTYHTEGSDGSQLLAQEKALLYILLEVGVCVGELPPPPVK